MPRAALQIWRGFAHPQQGRRGSTRDWQTNLIPAMRPERAQPRHGLVPKYALGGIFFFRLEVSYVCPQGGVLGSGDDALLRAKA